MEKQVRCFVKMIKGSPRKLNLVAQMIRKKPVNSALNMLSLSKKRMAESVKKAVLSAIANAQNNHGLNPEKLSVQEAYVGKAMVLKRVQPGSRGQANKILKPFSNLTVVVSETIPAAVVSKEKAKSVKKTGVKKEAK